MTEKKKNPVKEFFINVVGYIAMGIGYLFMGAIVLGMIAGFFNIIMGAASPFAYLFGLIAGLFS